jgi:hypothetical protein
LDKNGKSGQNHEREHTRTGMSADAIKRAFRDNLFYVQGRFPDVVGQVPQRHQRHLDPTFRHREQPGPVRPAH